MADETNQEETFTGEEEKTVLNEKFGEKVAIKDVSISLSAVLGKNSLRVHQLLKLGRGAVVELNRHKIARGDIVVTENNKVGIRISEIIKSQV